MSTFNIAYNDIPRRAALITAGNENANHPHENLFYGPTGIYWQSNGNQTASTITLDLGSGNTAPVDYLALRGLRTMIQGKGGATVDVELHGSTDNFAASDVTIITMLDIELTDLRGRYNEDLIETIPLSTAYRYWRIEINSTSGITHLLHKAYFGRLFNFGGISPRYPFSSNLDTGAGRGFISDAGTTFSTSSGRAVSQKQLSWHGLSDAITEEFREKIEPYLSDFPVFLYTPLAFPHVVIANLIVFGWLSSQISSGDKYTNANSISMNFREDILG